MQSNDALYLTNLLTPGRAIKNLLTITKSENRAAAPRFFIAVRTFRSDICEFTRTCHMLQQQQLKIEIGKSVLHTVKYGMTWVHGGAAFVISREKPKDL